MSLRSWNTAYERNQLQRDLHNLHVLIRHASVELLVSQDEDDFDEDDVSSFSSSDDSMSSLSSMDSSMDDELDLVETATEQVLISAHRI